MGATVGGHHPVGAEQEDELAEQGLAVSQRLGLEPFVRLGVGTLEVQPRLAHRSHDDPVARQIDGVLVALLDG